MGARGKTGPARAGAGAPVSPARLVAARTLARARGRGAWRRRPRPGARAASRGTVPGAGGARRWGSGPGLGARTPGDGCLPLPPPVACAAGMPAARNIPVRAWSPVGTGHDGALGLSYSASDEVKYRRLSLARVHACLSMLGSQRIGGVNGIFATSRCMCHCVRQDLISVQFYCTVTTAYLVTELSIIGTNLMVRSFPSSLLIMFLPYQQFC